VSAVPQSLVCIRVREQVSLELDGELSQLERRMLEGHLARCADCGAYADDVKKFTTELRTAPLEPIRRPVIVHCPRRISLARAQVGLAAAVMIAVVGSVLQLGLPSVQDQSTIQEPTRFPTLAEGRSEMQRAIVDRKTFQRHRTGPTIVI
jgi:predicted anti-sigma-YlaC factor YlaD